MVDEQKDGFGGASRFSGSPSAIARGAMSAIDIEIETGRSAEFMADFGKAAVCSVDEAWRRRASRAFREFCAASGIIEKRTDMSLYEAEREILVHIGGAIAALSGEEDD